MVNSRVVPLVAGAEILTIIVFFICGIRVTWLLTETKAQVTLPVYLVGEKQEGGRVILLCAPCLGVGTQVVVTVCPWTLEFHGFAGQVPPPPRIASLRCCPFLSLEERWLQFVLLGRWLCSSQWCCLLTVAHRDLWEFVTHGWISTSVSSCIAPCSLCHQTNSDASGAKGLGYVFCIQLLNTSSRPKYWLIKYIYSTQPFQSVCNLRVGWE